MLLSSLSCPGSFDIRILQLFIAFNQPLSFLSLGTYPSLPLPPPFVLMQLQDFSNHDRPGEVFYQQRV